MEVVTKQPLARLVADVNSSYRAPMIPNDVTTRTTMPCQSVSSLRSSDSSGIGPELLEKVDGTLTKSKSSVRCKPDLVRWTATRKLSQIEKVKFNNKLDVKIIEIPCSEKTERWYTNMEYFVFRREATRAARKKERAATENKPKDDNVVCFSGLGMVDNELLKARETRVRKALEMIQKEQKRSIRRIQVNPVACGDYGNGDWIAKQYYEMSCEARKEALLTAQENETEAREYLGTTRTQWLVEIQEWKKMIEQLSCLWKVLDQ